jgi:hypothetical protein
MVGNEVASTSNGGFVNGSNEFVYCGTDFFCNVCKTTVLELIDGAVPCLSCHHRKLVERCLFCSRLFLKNAQGVLLEHKACMLKELVAEFVIIIAGRTFKVDAKQFDSDELEVPMVVRMINVPSDMTVRQVMSDFCWTPGINLTEPTKDLLFGEFITKYAAFVAETPSKLIKGAIHTKWSDYGDVKLSEVLPPVEQWKVAQNETGEAVLTFEKERITAPVPLPTPASAPTPPPVRTKEPEAPKAKQRRQLIPSAYFINNMAFKNDRQLSAKEFLAEQLRNHFGWNEAMHPTTDESCPILWDGKLCVAVFTPVRTATLDLIPKHCLSSGYILCFPFMIRSINGIMWKIAFRNTARLDAFIKSFARCMPRAKNANDHYFAFIRTTAIEEEEYTSERFSTKEDGSHHMNGQELEEKCKKNDKDVTAASFFGDKLVRYWTSGERIQWDRATALVARAGKAPMRHQEEEEENDFYNDEHSSLDEQDMPTKKKLKMT